MASTYSNLKFELIGTGDQSGTWGTTTNTNLGTAIEQALVGMATISSGFVTNSLTLTLTDTNAAQNARALVLNLTQALSGAGTLNVPAIQKPYMIINATGQTVTVKVTGLTGVAVPTGTRAFLYNNGTDVGDFFNYASSLTLGTDLAIADGGTGASSAPVARTNLGATTVGSNLFTLTNPSAITFLRINADNTVSALDAATFRTAIGAGTGAGTVTSVSGTGTVQGLSLSGTVTGSGNITLGGSLSAVSLTTQVSGTLPVANGGTGTTSTTFVNLATNVTGTLPVANGGTGGSTQAAARTGIGATTVGSNFFTLTNPSAITFPRMNADNTVSALDAATFRTAIGAGTGAGTVTSVATTGTVNGITLTGGTITTTGTITLGGTLSGVSLTTQVTGTLPIANGGTNLTTYTTGDILYASTTNVIGKLAVGTNGQVLRVSSGVPAYGGIDGGTF